MRSPGWVKLNPSLHSAPAIRVAGLEATGLYAMGLTYCARNQSAHIPSSWVREQPHGRRASRRLVENHLWLPRGDGFEPLLEERGVLRLAEINYTSPERVPKWLRRLIFDRDGGVCQLCEGPVTGVFHVDHILPASRGGKTTALNLQLAHPFCNISKGNRV